MKRIFVFVFLFPICFFSQSNFGPPSNPTYGVVQTNIPQGYYDQANNLSSDELKEALHQIISNHVVFPYTSNSTDTWDILQESDQDPNENNNMILVYTGRSQEKDTEMVAEIIHSTKMEMEIRVIRGIENIFGLSHMAFPTIMIMHIQMFTI